MALSSSPSFPDYVALLHQFLDRRQEIVDTLESSLLNVQGKPLSRSRDRRHFEQILDSCFFTLPGLPHDLARLKGQLAARHLADGFEPLLLERFPNELDPLELIVRAYAHWDHHRWPGKNGRLSYARTIYCVFMLRQLEYLSLTVWDDGNEQAGARLQDVQRLLDRLNEGASPNTFVRDARWLMYTAQGPVTRRLEPYFRIAEAIAGSFTDSDRLEAHKAGAKLAGGHLRSQRRYAMWRTGRPIDHDDVLSSTRNSNSMDSGLLVHDLVPLLEAYEAACAEQDRERRLDLADAILQGMSADPELFLTRLDLLGPYTMVEDLFVAADAEGRARYTPMGHAHVRRLERYGALVGRLAESLSEDALTFNPAHIVYSPYGIVYGFVADILSNMAMDTLLAQPSLGLALEDTFVSLGSLEDKLARAKGWEKLPKREGESEHFAHSADYGGQIFARLTTALEARARHGTRPNASALPDVKVFLVSETDSVESLPAGLLPAGVRQAQRHCFTSDLKRAAVTQTTALPKSRILEDRREGRFLASAELEGKWFAISKVILTLFAGHGRDALITDVPGSVVEVLRLTCAGLIARVPAVPARQDA